MTGITASPLLTMRGISKRFAGVQALDQVNFTVHSGEVHALMGENGAGKSTLIKVLTGVYPRDAGNMELAGAPFSARTPREAQLGGVSTVYQEVNLVPGLSVAENICLGRTRMRGGFLPWGSMKRRARALGVIRQHFEVLNAEYVTKQITRMETSITADPELAIGTAKEFIETICKTILRECGVTVSASIDLPQLVKVVREKLDLMPENIPEGAKGVDTIKRLLSNLGTVAQGLAELRGLYGSGHGKEAKAQGLQPRHARLAVNSACALGLFLFETYQERKCNPILFRTAE